MKAKKLNALIDTARWTYEHKFEESGMTPFMAIDAVVRTVVNLIEVEKPKPVHPSDSEAMRIVRAAAAKLEPKEPVSCRSEEGITVGLIDSLIFICRVLSKRDLTHPEVLEALADLGSDEDLKYIMRARESQ